MSKIDLNYIIIIADNIDRDEFKFKLLAAIAGFSNRFCSEELDAIAREILPATYIWAIADYLEINKIKLRKFLIMVENDRYEDYKLFI